MQSMPEGGSPWMVSISNDAENLRSANRNRNKPTNCNNNNGFRLAQSARSPELDTLRGVQV